MRQFTAILSIFFFMALTVGTSPDCSASPEDSETLHGKVTRDNNARLPRPAAPLSAAASKSATQANTLNAHSAKLEAGSFDLDAQNQRMRASAAVSALQAQERMDSLSDPRAEIEADMDRFFGSSGVPSLSPGASAGLSGGIVEQHRLFVLIQIGLCGSWDAQGDGRRRWQLLSSEVHSRGPLADQWRQWQQNVSQMVEANLWTVSGVRGNAAIHVQVAHDGTLGEISDHIHGPHDPALSQFVQSTIRDMGRLPAFPSGSQAPEAHILVSVISH